MAVTRYLWSQGVPKDLLDATARGDTHFVAANSSKAGKAKNRRVEIIVIKEGRDAEALTSKLSSERFARCNSPAPPAHVS